MFQSTLACASGYKAFQSTSAPNDTVVQAVHWFNFFSKPCPHTLQQVNLATVYALILLYEPVH